MVDAINYSDYNLINRHKVIRSYQKHASKEATLDKNRVIAASLANIINNSDISLSEKAYLIGEIRRVYVKYLDTLKKELENE
jgi:hypothetical protein